MAHDPNKLAYWADHYRSWQSSGLSQRSYCQREGLSYAAFDHWRRRVRGGASLPATATSKRVSKLTLVPVQLDVAASRGNDIQLRSPSGWQVTLPATFDGAALAQLLAHLP